MEILFSVVGFHKRNGNETHHDLFEFKSASANVNVFYQHHADIMTLYDCSFLRWELLDDPSQSSLCSCCDSTCKWRSKRGVERGITFLPTRLFFLFFFRLCFILMESLNFSPRPLSESHSLSHNSVLGPLIIVDPSDSKAHSIPEVSAAAADSQA